MYNHSLLANETAHACRKEGREAFQRFGVTGRGKHSYLENSFQLAAFLEGFYAAKEAAAEQALQDAKNYHSLTVSEAERDRYWANKLASRQDANQAPPAHA
ncbi:uncharacterized protein NMK_2457 [Novimethylophilus kurashikiensis]|uniref:Uncharacterized protein n=2 Tax=Novimethylophilus kurashikiensis TaxID=1825523 RepID=A0A2R5F9G4_9PROT|nr:uncharacterized protein NMK_2457 [Novimethylophilus kurashikiensis]